MLYIVNCIFPFVSCLSPHFTLTANSFLIRTLENSSSCVIIHVNILLTYLVQSCDFSFVSNIKM